jgi:hypothetical protein
MGTYQIDNFADIFLICKFLYVVADCVSSLSLVEHSEKMGDGFSLKIIRIITFHD